MHKNKIDMKLSLSREEAISYLEDLLKSLKAGTVVVQEGEDFVSMVPGEQVLVNLGAQMDTDRNSFNFTMSWSQTEHRDLAVQEKAAVPAKTERTPLARRFAAPPARSRGAKGLARKRSITKPCTTDPVEHKPPVKPGDCMPEPVFEEKAAPKTTSVKPHCDLMTKPTTTGTKP
ncbi:amphi-Trp domain-containing protein [Salidesulfovibrio onnuriiensis]|uniref:amphi-Trp domain-containing protein n=1 Tax=Salidesulfovibrio onnuriiensis TaxID=2583823 RepID=UPI0011C9059B|nr:amphi-Trp domain-containing protein [Salidesulfovibrio onnuriiensis]